MSTQQKQRTTIMTYVPNYLEERLKHFFGFDTFKTNQKEIIQTLMEGKNVFVLMPTGGGKSLCYQLPALLEDGLTIVVSPLIALMKNQVDMLRGYSDSDATVHCLNSLMTREEIAQVKHDIHSGDTKLLYLAPEAMKKKENVAFLRKQHISFYAIDEAHCISEWGHDFRPEYSQLATMIQDIGQAPIIALTSTATPKVQHDILKNLDIEDAIVYKSSFNRPNLYYQVLPKSENINKNVIHFIRRMAGKSGIIYCLTRQEVNDLTNVLKSNGITAAPYHAGLEADIREKNQDDFLMEKVQVIVATIAFGMGIDKPDVRFVIHYDISKSLEGYYQETGRAGRDGGEGICICYYAPKDIDRLRKLQQDKGVMEKTIAEQLINEVRDYCETTLCRRKFLLAYFGENYDNENCGKCDNCAKVYQRVDMSEELITIIETIQELNEQYDTKHIVNLLRGEKNSDIIGCRHDELECCGIYKNLSENVIYTIIREALVQGLITKNVTNYGLLNITKLGLKYLRKPTPFIIPIEAQTEPLHDGENNNDEDSDADDDTTPMITETTSVLDEALYNILKDIRSEIAHRKDIPPYVIFQDAALEAMATNYPITIEELQNLPGMSVGKAKRYGTEFLTFIQKYIVENDITRPEDIIETVTISHTAQQIAIIQGLDRHCDLDMLCENVGIKMDELLDELENFVKNGRKIDIEYYVIKVVPKDEYNVIEDYFRHSESADLDKAMETLDYPDEDLWLVRLVRIKLLSEWGN